MVDSHETSDVRARPVALAGVLLLLFAGAALVSMLGFEALFIADRPSAAQAAPALPGPDSPAYPIEDWRQVHAEQSRDLGEAAWVNREAGVVRLPIERAMALLVERALLPVRKTGPTRDTPKELR